MAVDHALLIQVVDEKPGAIAKVHVVTTIDGPAKDLWCASARRNGFPCSQGYFTRYQHQTNTVHKQHVKRAVATTATVCGSTLSSFCHVIVTKLGSIPKAACV